MRNHIVAIQGSLSSFHDLAAKKYFGEEISTLACNSFKEVCQQIASNVADYGIIAIENKVAGSILLNYQLIAQYELKIIGEIFLPIELHLLGKKGSDLNHIREIISHPMALGQCQNFLAENSSILATEYRDTAQSAQRVKKENNFSLGVIAGPQIAETYELEVIVPHISDVQFNYTRFYIVSKYPDYEVNPNKASVTIQTKHEIGSLSDVLSLIKTHQINLSKIQSVPVPNLEDVYAFHLDLEFNSKEQFDQMIEAIDEYCTTVKILGLYTSKKLEWNQN